MGRKVWVVPVDTQVNDDVVAEAEGAEADEVSNGVPASLAYLAAPGFTGLLEVPDPDPPPESAPDRLVVLAAKVDDGGLTDGEVAEAVGLLLKRLA